MSLDPRLDRRDFIASLAGSGLVVLFRCGSAVLLPGAGADPTPPELPDRLQRLPPDRCGRPHHVLRGQGRAGAGVQDRARAAVRRGARRRVRHGGHGDGGHRAVPVGHGHVRLAHRPAVRPRAARGRGRGEGGAAADGRREAPGAVGSARRQGRGCQRRPRPSHEGHVRAARRGQAHRAAPREGSRQGGLFVHRGRHVRRAQGRPREGDRQGQVRRRHGLPGHAARADRATARARRDAQGSGHERGREGHGHQSRAGR